MADAPLAADSAPSENRVVWSRTVFHGLAWLFLLGIGVQVFLVGMGIFVDASWWAWHRGFVHALELVPVVLLVLACTGQMPPALKWLSVAAFLLIGVQYATIEMGVPVFAAFHPVNAMLLFWLVLTLARRVGDLINP